MWTTTVRFALLALLVTIGCGRAPIAGPDAPGPPNVIIVLVDTLRADHMSLYGYERPTTPFIDSFASEAIVFDRARAQASCTFPSVNSLFTSRYPFDFYSQGEGQMGIPSKYATIAEILRARGYHTIAVSASPIVRKTPSKENPNGGFGAGFDVFDEACLWNSAECVNNRALELVASAREPFFLYLHYMDPHGRYVTPPGYVQRFAGQYDGYDFIAAGDITPIGDMIYGDGPELDITDRDVQHLIDLYDDEIRYFDGEFARLIEFLREDNLLDRSLLAFTSDHGEEFLEHGHVGHCRGVWDTLTRVPLLMKLPNRAGGSRVDAAVQLVDIVPTLFDEIGIDATTHDLEGITLRQLIDGDPPARVYAYSDQGRYRASDDGRWHFILDGVELSAKFYDFCADPLEQRDLVAGGDPEIDRLSAALNRWLQDTGQWVLFDEALAAGKAKEEELRALGYIQ